MSVDLFDHPRQLPTQVRIAGVPLGHPRVLLPQHVRDRVLVVAEFPQQGAAGVPQSVDGEPLADLPLGLQPMQELEDGGPEAVLGPG